MADLLTNEDFINLLQLRFNNPGIKFEKAEFRSLTEKKQGFSGEHNILQITYSLKETVNIVNFFVKSKLKEIKPSKLTDEIYEKETFFYDNLLKEFDNRGYNTSFAPKAYLCKNNEIMVLEDLISKGYFLPKRTELYDLERIKSSLESLAYFHASALIFEEEKSQEQGTKFRLDQNYNQQIFKEKFLIFSDPDALGYKYFYSTMKCFETLIGALEESESWKADFIRRMKNINFLEVFTTELGPRKTLGHGDLWSNNMLFKRENDNLKCCILDYQILRYFNLAFDVNYIINVNTRKELRNQHQLFEYYYTTLEGILAQRNLKLENIYSKDDYEKSLKYYKVVARFQACVAHSFTFFDIEKLKNILKEKSFADMLDGDRSLLLLEAFSNDMLFKEIMTENLYDLRDILVHNDSN